MTRKWMKLRGLFPVDRRQNKPAVEAVKSPTSAPQVGGAASAVAKGRRVLASLQASRGHRRARAQRQVVALGPVLIVPGGQAVQVPTVAGGTGTAMK